jgi:hypothetical protein
LLTGFVLSLENQLALDQKFEEFDRALRTFIVPIKQRDDICHIPTVTFVSKRIKGIRLLLNK